MFAKLFGTDVDQVLVKIDTGEEGNPEVRVYCQPEGLGVCSVAASWDDDTDASWDKAEKAFAQIDEAKARSMAETVCKQLGVSMPNNGGEGRAASVRTSPPHGSVSDSTKGCDK